MLIQNILCVAGCFSSYFSLLYFVDRYYCSVVEWLFFSAVFYLQIQVLFSSYFSLLYSIYRYNYCLVVISLCCFLFKDTSIVQQLFFSVAFYLKIQVLFNETFYTDKQSKYQVWCIDRPLSFEPTMQVSAHAQSMEFRILNNDDAMELLFTGKLH